MKDDRLISLNAAIDMLKNRWKKTRHYEGIGDDIAEECELYLKQVPSAQPSVSKEEMVGDAVSRQGVLRLLNAVPSEEFATKAMLISGVNALPSAQPGQRNARVFQGIVVEYPSISVYPEYEGKPYFSIKYTENGQEFIGYGTYKPEVLSEYLKEYFMPPTQPGWIPCKTALPQEDGEYLVTIHWESGGYYTDLLIYKAYLKEWQNEDRIFGTVIAWQPKPTPWEGEKDDG